MTDELQRVWERVRVHLDRAWVQLPASEGDGSDLAEYHFNLDHNELELAMDALAAAGQDRGAGNAFWLEVAAAAETMGLSDKATTFRALVI